MAFWWVNQNQTWKHEISGRYMWSPKRNQNGARNQFYENMHRTDTGDVVFSYYDQRIQHLGVVQRPAVTGAKPADFGLTGDYWSNEGWFVPVAWYKVPNPFRPKDILTELRPHLPPKYSPLQRETGDGLQSVYLASVPDAMAQVLLAELGKFAADVARFAQGIGDEEGAITGLDDELEKTIRNNTSIDETERQAVISARRGQGRFRQNLEEIEHTCRITGISDPRLLRASHIKPWRSCTTNHERLDGFNGLLLTPHIDHLFDRGYISFDDDGQVLLSSKIDLRQLALLGIHANPPLRVGPFLNQQRSYLCWHRENVFVV